MDNIYYETNDIAETLRSDLLGGTENEAASNRDISRRNREIQTFVKKYKNWASSIKSVGESMYARYREENQKNRKDNKTPLAFKFNYLLPEDAKNIDVDNIKTSDNSKTNNQLARELSTKIKTELDSYHKTIKSVQNISAEEFDMDQLDKKISEIEKVKKNKPDIDDFNIKNEEPKKNIKKEEKKDDGEKKLKEEIESQTDGITNIKEF